MRIAAGVVGVAVIFGAGYRVAHAVWSNKYDRLQITYAQEVAELQSEQQAWQRGIDAQTREREEQLLTKLQNQRRRYDLLKRQIDETPLVDGSGCDVDWVAFGRLFDDAAKDDSQGMPDPDAADNRNATGAAASDIGAEFP